MSDDPDQSQERPCLHCLIVDLVDDFYAEYPAAPDETATLDTDEVLSAVAKTVAEEVNSLRVVPAPLLSFATQTLPDVSATLNWGPLSPPVVSPVAVVLATPAEVNSLMVAVFVTQRFPYLSMLIHVGAVRPPPVNPVPLNPVPGTYSLRVLPL